MPSLPAKLAHGDSLQELVPTINALIECVRAITPRPSPTMRVRTLPSGTVLSARPAARVPAPRRGATAAARWNGMAYDFYGFPFYDWRNDPAAKDPSSGKWIVGGTHLKIIPSVSGDTVSFSAVMVDEITDRNAIYYKVADRVDGIYTLTDDQIGAIRLPFPTTGRPYQVYSFNANGLPGFDWVRAHVGQAPPSGGGEGGEGEGGEGE